MLSYKQYSDNELLENLQPLAEDLVNPAFLKNNDIKQLSKKFSRADRTEREAIVVDMYSKVSDVLDGALKKFESTMKKALKKHKKAKFLSGTKPLGSIIDKTVKRGRDFSQLNDLVRGAILFDTKAEADKFVKDFTRKNSSLIVGYEEKVRGGDKMYGYYGSHHMDLMIDGVVVELQLMSKKLWQYKHEAHKIYTANRSKEGGPSKADAALSKKIFSMAAMKEDVELEFFVEELDEMTFEIESGIDYQAILESIDQ